jgi:hypothetical protein
MTQSEAREILQKAMRAFQRYRSTSMELGVGEAFFAKSMWPWVYGDKCPLPAIVKMLDREKIVPQEFYNIMFILYKFTPEVKMQGEIEQVLNDVRFEFPTPDIRWLVEGFAE